MRFDNLHALVCKLLLFSSLHPADLTHINPLLVDLTHINPVLSEDLSKSELIKMKNYLLRQDKFTQNENKSKHQNSTRNGKKSKHQKKTKCQENTKKRVNIAYTMKQLFTKSLLDEKTKALKQGFRDVFARIKTTQIPFQVFTPYIIKNYYNLECGHWQLPATFRFDFYHDDQDNLELITKICNIYDIYVTRIKDYIDMFFGNVFNTGNTDMNIRICNYFWDAYKFVNPGVMERMRINDKQTYDHILNLLRKYISEIETIIKMSQGYFPPNFKRCDYDEDDDRTIANLGFDVIPKHMHANLEIVLMSRITSLLKLLTNLGGNYLILRKFDDNKYKNLFYKYLVRVFVLNETQWTNWKNIVWNIQQLRDFNDDCNLPACGMCHNCFNCQSLHRAIYNGLDVLNATTEQISSYLCTKWDTLFEEQKNELMN